MSLRSGAGLSSLLGLAVVAIVAWGPVELAWAARGARGRDRLIQAAKLRASDGETEFSSVAMSGGVVVAGAPLATVGANQDQGAVYLFTRPPGGWSDETETAKLIASDGSAGDYFGTTTAISGDTVVVQSAGQAVCTLATPACPGQTASGRVLYVFTEPPGGWTGTVEESAKLTVAGPAIVGFGGVAISGNTIVAFPVPPAEYLEVPTGYAFTRPAAGWSGTVLPSATLSISNGSLYSGLGPSIALSSHDIFATVIPSGTPTEAVSVFHQPAVGSTGTIDEQARLIAPPGGGLGPIAAFGQSLVAGVSGSGSPTAAPIVDVFVMPKRGWSTTARPTASLRPRPLFNGGESSAYVGSLAASGRTIAGLVLGPTSSNCFPTNICGETLYTFRQPARGWRGAIPTESSARILRQPLQLSAAPLAIEGQTIATGGHGAIDILTQTIHRLGTAHERVAKHTKPPVGAVCLGRQRHFPIVARAAVTPRLLLRTLRRPKGQF